MQCSNRAGLPMQGSYSTDAHEDGTACPWQVVQHHGSSLAALIQVQQAGLASWSCSDKAH